MSPVVPKAPSPAKDVHMSGATPTPKGTATPCKPGYTPVKSPDYKKARRTLFEDAHEATSLHFATVTLFFPARRSREPKTILRS